MNHGTLDSRGSENPMEMRAESDVPGRAAR